MSRITEIFPQGQVSEAQEDLEAYSIKDQKTKTIVWPTDEEQLRQLLRYVIRTDTTILIKGSGTSQRVKQIPQNSIILDTSRKNKIIKADLKQKTATVEAGLLIKDLNDFLLDYGLEFPIKPDNPTSTIGGLIAVNGKTRRTARYPELIDWVEELEVMDGSGKLYSTKTVKDFIGSEGVNALILKAKIKLTEPIKKTRIQSYAFDHSLDVLEKIKDLEQDPTLLSLEMIEKTSSSILKEPERYFLLAEFTTEDLTSAEDMKLWKEVRDLHSILCQKGYDVIEDVKIPRENIPKILMWIRKNKIPARVDMSLGIIYLYFRKNQNTTIKELYLQTKKLEGNVNGCYGIGTQKKEYIEKELKEEVKELKQIYDPDNTLNRGIIL